MGDSAAEYRRRNGRIVRAAWTRSEDMTVSCYTRGGEYVGWVPLAELTPVNGAAMRKLQSLGILPPVPARQPSTTATVRLRRGRMNIAEIRGRLEAAAKEAAAADQSGAEIEHMNHRVLEAAHELGRALNARAASRACSIPAPRAVSPA